MKTSKQHCRRHRDIAEAHNTARVRVREMQMHAGMQKKKEKRIFNSKLTQFFSLSVCLGGGPPPLSKLSFVCAQRENKIFYHNNYPFDRTRKFLSLSSFSGPTFRVQRAEQRRKEEKRRKSFTSRKVFGCRWWLFQGLDSTLIRSEFISTRTHQRTIRASERESCIRKIRLTSPPRPISARRTSSICTLLYGPSSASRIVYTIIWVNFSAHFSISNHHQREKETLYAEICSPHFLHSRTPENHLSMWKSWMKKKKVSNSS